MDEITVTIRYKVHNTRPMADEYGGTWSAEDVARKMVDDAHGLFGFGTYGRCARTDEITDITVTSEVHPCLMWSDHKRDDGQWCPWSKTDVTAKAPEKCPGECRDCTLVPSGREERGI